MKTITLQTKNIKEETKERADKLAKELGYTSIQDVIRLFIEDFSHGRIDLKRDWGLGLNPEIREAFQEYKDGKLVDIDPDKDLIEEFDRIRKENEEEIQNQTNSKISKKRD